MTTTPDLSDSPLYSRERSESDERSTDGGVEEVKVEDASDDAILVDEEISEGIRNLQERLSEADEFLRQEPEQPRPSEPDRPDLVEPDPAVAARPSQGLVTSFPSQADKNQLEEFLYVVCSDTYENYTAFANLSCPTYSETDQFTIPFFQFWIDNQRALVQVFGDLIEIVRLSRLTKPRQYFGQELLLRNRWFAPLPIFGSFGGKNHGFDISRQRHAPSLRFKLRSFVFGQSQ